MYIFFHQIYLFIFQSQVRKGCGKVFWKTTIEKSDRCLRAGLAWKMSTFSILEDTALHHYNPTLTFQVMLFTYVYTLYLFFLRPWSVSGSETKQRRKDFCYRGSFSDTNSRLKKLDAKDVASCIILCVDDPQCKSVNYDTATSLCQISNLIYDNTSATSWKIVFTPGMSSWSLSKDGCCKYKNVCIAIYVEYFLIFWI